MKTLLTTAATLALLTAPAWAQAGLDADGDGNVTMDELQAAFPEATADQFAAMDTDADGVLNAEEVAAAQAAGILPS